MPPDTPMNGTSAAGWGAMRACGIQHRQVAGAAGERSLARHGLQHFQCRPRHIGPSSGRLGTEDEWRSGCRPLGG
jgi:hypothetical protein